MIGGALVLDDCWDGKVGERKKRMSLGRRGGLVEILGGSWWSLGRMFLGWVGVHGLGVYFDFGLGFWGVGLPWVGLGFWGGWGLGLELG